MGRAAKRRLLYPVGRRYDLGDELAATK